MKNILKLQKCLGYEFKDKNLITEALTHKSYKKPYNNERLEFLGDAVLDLVVGEYLYKNFSKVDEGVLSKMRASLVNEKGLARIANKLNIGEYLYLSSAEENNKGREKPSLLSNTFEALMGAMYLESNLEYVRPLINRLLEEVYPDMDLESLFKDYKTSLQELTQSIYSTTPEYKLLSAKGPDHKKEFEVMVVIDNRKFAAAKGHSKKEAQQKAAQKALEILKQNKDI